MSDNNNNNNNNNIITDEYYSNQLAAGAIKSDSRDVTKVRQGTFTWNYTDNAWDITDNTLEKLVSGIGPKRKEQQTDKKEFKINSEAEHFQIWMNAANVDLHFATHQLHSLLERIRRHRFLLESSPEYRQASIRDYQQKVSRGDESQIKHFMQKWERFLQSLGEVQTELDRYKALDEYDNKSQSQT